MTPEIADATVRTCLRSMSETLNDAASLARAASGCAEEGNRDGAVRIALDVEELLHEATSLLSVASFVNRKADT